jgi:hypothetical protein
MGWRRTWRHTLGHPAPFLTAEPYEGVSIQGAIAPVPNADWEALDAREHGYDRVSIDHAISHEGPARDISVYWVPVDKHDAPDQKHPIWLSYLDAVVQGFHTVFGPDGVTSFFETTAGWDCPILDDRKASLYPRSVILTETETRMVDDALARLATVVEKL